jgi:uncharacterized damage-inducible protein DinB
MDQLSFPAYLTQLYDYNYWANRRFIAVAAGLSAEQLFRDHAQGWGNVHHTLVHMMSAEWVWLQRWQGHSPRALLPWEDFPTVAPIQIRWAALEDEMRRFVTAQTPVSLQRKVTYTNTKGINYTLELWQMMVHVANHGTHHRGELAAMFALMDVPHPEEDWFLYFLERSGQLRD